jgi:hypothetical protein
VSVILTHFIATCAGRVSSQRSTSPFGLTSPRLRMLSYHLFDPKIVQIRSFGTTLEPRYIVGTEPLDQ